jgi:predicted nucleic acid-binding protein
LKGANYVTNSLFFDTDCVSAFLWVNEQRLLSQLYPDRVVIPKPVYNELSYVPHLKQGVDSLINNHKAKLEHLNVDTELYNLYHKLTRNPDPGYKVIGAGEAASIAMAKIYDGIVASNNLSDINVYINRFSLKHLTTGDILVDAFKQGIISESQGNQIWANMLSKRRLLGASSFTEYLGLKNKQQSG